MILVDKALAAREVPIRVGMIGAGFMGQAVARQIVMYTPRMELAAICNRHLGGAIRAFGEIEINVNFPRYASTAEDLEKAIAEKMPAVADRPEVICEAPSIDVVLEVTGAVEFGARVALSAFEHGKHLVTMNAELMGTLGPILKYYADRAGVIYTDGDGDQPGVSMNLYRFVRGIGIRPVLCGNIKGFHDSHRNPTTQEGFARKWGQKPHMVTSFADGSKISFEQAIVANATGMKVGRRGMYGPMVESGTPLEMAVQDCFGSLPFDGPGIVDYVVGAHPAAGVFVLGVCDDAVQQHYLHLYKLGTGPLYCFYTPYHLCHFEVSNTIARAALFGDAAITPLNGPCVDVVATAKIDLEIGDELDGIGWYKTYGLCENSDTTWREGLLPLGLAEGCRMVRPVRRDQVLTYDDIQIPPGRLSDRLRAEQDERWAGGGLK